MNCPEEYPDPWTNEEKELELRAPLDWNIFWMPSWHSGRMEIRGEFAKTNQEVLYDTKGTDGSVSNTGQDDAEFRWV